MTVGMFNAGPIDVSKIKLTEHEGVIIYLSLVLYIIYLFDTIYSLFRYICLMLTTTLANLSRRNGFKLFMNAFKFYL